MLETRGTRSVTGEVIINEVLKSSIEDRRVFSGSGFDHGHKLVERKFKFTND
jgi:hypothetical protein